MLVPETYLAALSLTILTMLCWGSWANTLKLCPKYRFQLFYWDYVIGMVLGAVFWGFTAGSRGHEGLPFLTDLKQTATGPMFNAIVGGAIFSVANLLLVAAIDVAGLAVAFPVGIGLALVIGAVSNYVIKPVGNPLLLFGGVALVVVAIVLDAAAFRARERTAKATTVRGIVISLAAGVLMGCFYPFVARALNGDAQEEAARWIAAGGRGRLSTGADGVASGGNPRRSDLGYRRRREFSGLGRPPGRAGGLV
jgi:glucose uptake protein